MNRIYKVIYSKLKNQYVVVSELAKNHCRGGVRAEHTQGRSLAGRIFATVVATGFVLCSTVHAEVTATNIVPQTGTAITGSADIYVQQKIDEIGLNNFSDFAVKNGDVINMYLNTQDGKNSVSHLVNLVQKQILIDGIVNGVSWNGTDKSIGGHLYFLSPNGFALGSTGYINAGSLTVLTPTETEFNKLYGKTLTDSADKEILKNWVANPNVIPLNPSGTILVNGDINTTEDIKLYAGKKISIASESSLAAEQLNLLTGVSDFSTVNTGNPTGITLKASTSGNVTGDIVLAVAAENNEALIDIQKSNLIAANVTISASSEQNKANINIENSTLSGANVAVNATAVNEAAADIQSTTVKGTNNVTVSATAQNEEALVKLQSSEIIGGKAALTASSTKEANVNIQGGSVSGATVNIGTTTDKNVAQISVQDGSLGGDTLVASIKTNNEEANVDIHGGSVSGADVAINATSETDIATAAADNNYDLQRSAKVALKQTTVTATDKAEFNANNIANLNVTGATADTPANLQAALTSEVAINASTIEAKTVNIKAAGTGSIGNTDSKNINNITQNIKADLQNATIMVRDTVEQGKAGTIDVQASNELAIYGAQNTVEQNVQITVDGGTYTTSDDKKLADTITPSDYEAIQSGTFNLTALNNGKITATAGSDGVASNNVTLANAVYLKNAEVSGSTDNSKIIKLQAALQATNATEITSTSAGGDSQTGEVKAGNTVTSTTEVLVGDENSTTTGVDATTKFNHAAELQLLAEDKSKVTATAGSASHQGAATATNTLGTSAKQQKVTAQIVRTAARNNYNEYFKNNVLTQAVDNTTIATNAQTAATDSAIAANANTQLYRDLESSADNVYVGYGSEGLYNMNLNAQVNNNANLATVATAASSTDQQNGSTASAGNTIVENATAKISGGVQETGDIGINRLTNMSIAANATPTAQTIASGGHNNAARNAVTNNTQALLDGANIALDNNIGIVANTVENITTYAGVNAADGAPSSYGTNTATVKADGSTVAQVKNSRITFNAYPTTDAVLIATKNRAGASAVTENLAGLVIAADSERRLATLAYSLKTDNAALPLLTSTLSGSTKAEFTNTQVTSSDIREYKDFTLRATEYTAADNKVAGSGKLQHQSERQTEAVLDNSTVEGSTVSTDGGELEAKNATVQAKQYADVQNTVVENDAATVNVATELKDAAQARLVGMNHAFTSISGKKYDGVNTSVAVEAEQRESYALTANSAQSLNSTTTSTNIAQTEINKSKLNVQQSITDKTRNLEGADPNALIDYTVNGTGNITANATNTLAATIAAKAQATTVENNLTNTAQVKLTDVEIKTTGSSADVQGNALSQTQLTVDNYAQNTSTVATDSTTVNAATTKNTITNIDKVNVHNAKIKTAQGDIAFAASDNTDISSFTAATGKAVPVTALSETTLNRTHEVSVTNDAVNDDNLISGGAVVLAAGMGAKGGAAELKLTTLSDSYNLEAGPENTKPTDTVTLTQQNKVHVDSNAKVTSKKDMDLVAQVGKETVDNSARSYNMYYSNEEHTGGQITAKSVGEVNFANNKTNNVNLDGYLQAGYSRLEVGLKQDTSTTINGQAADWFGTGKEYTISLLDDGTERYWSLSDMAISGGDIRIVADSVTSNDANSVLLARAVRSITIENASDYDLHIGNLAVDKLGGHITFNGEQLTSTPATYQGRSQAQAWASQSKYWYTSPTINITNSGAGSTIAATDTTPEVVLQPDIILNGQISNPTGTINITNNNFNIQLVNNAGIEAQEVNLTASNGSVQQKVTDPSKAAYTAGNISAAKDINITAAKIDITGIVQSGYQKYNFEFSDKGLDKLAELKSKYATKVLTDEEVLGNADYLVNDTDKAGAYYDSSTKTYQYGIKVYFNPSTGHLLVENIEVGGGKITLTGDVTSSTGTGTLVALDGAADINIKSTQSDYDIVLHEISNTNNTGSVVVRDINNQNVKTYNTDGNYNYDANKWKTISVKILTGGEGNIIVKNKKDVYVDGNLTTGTQTDAENVTTGKGKIILVSLDGVVQTVGNSILTADNLFIFGGDDISVNHQGTGENTTLSLVSTGGAIDFNSTKGNLNFESGTSYTIDITGLESVLLPIRGAYAAGRLTINAAGDIIAKANANNSSKNINYLRGSDVHLNSEQGGIDAVVNSAQNAVDGNREAAGITASAYGDINISNKGIVIDDVLQNLRISSIESKTGDVSLSTSGSILEVAAIGAQELIGSDTREALWNKINLTAQGWNRTKLQYALPVEMTASLGTEAKTDVATTSTPTIKAKNITLTAASNVGIDSKAKTLSYTYLNNPEILTKEFSEANPITAEEAKLGLEAMRSANVDSLAWDDAKSQLVIRQQDPLTLQVAEDGEINVRAVSGNVFLAAVKDEDMTINGKIVAGSNVKLISDKNMTLNGSVTAGNDVQLNSGGNIAFADGILTAQNMNAQAQGSISQNTEHAAKITKNITLSAVSGINMASGALTEGSALRNTFLTAALSNTTSGDVILIGGTDSTSGDPLAADTMQITLADGMYADNLTLANVKLPTVTNKVGNITYQDIVDNDLEIIGAVNAKNDVSITNEEANVLIHKDVTAGNDVTVKAVGDVTTEGKVQADNDVSVNANGNVTTEGKVDAGKDVTVDAGGDVQAKADVTAGNDVGIKAVGDVTTMADVTAGDNVTINAEGIITTAANAKIVATNKDVTLSGKQGVVSNSAITSGNDTTVKAENGVADINASINAGNDAGVTTGNGDANINASISAGNDAVVTAGNGDANINASINAGNDAGVTTGNGAVNINAGINAGHDVNAKTNVGAVNINSKLEAGNDIAVATQQGDITNQAALQAGRDVLATTNSGNIKFAKDSSVNAGRDLTLVTEQKGAINLAGTTTVARNFIAETRGTGDIGIATNISAGNNAQVSTNIGNVNATNISAGNDAQVSTGTGNVNAINITAGNDAQVSTGTGNINATNISAGKDVKVSTGTGNVNAINITAGNDAQVSTNIGDVNISNINAENNATVHARSGEVNVAKMRAKNNATVIADGGNVNVQNVSGADVTLAANDATKKLEIGTAEVKSNLKLAGDYIHVANIVQRADGDSTLNITPDGAPTQTAAGMVYNRPIQTINLDSIKTNGNVVRITHLWTNDTSIAAQNGDLWLDNLYIVNKGKFSNGTMSTSIFGTTPDYAYRSNINYWVDNTRNNPRDYQAEWHDVPGIHPRWLYIRFDGNSKSQHSNGNLLDLDNGFHVYNERYSLTNWMRRELDERFYDSHVGESGENVDLYDRFGLVVLAESMRASHQDAEIIISNT